MSKKLIGTVMALAVGILAFAGTAVGDSGKDSKITLAVGAAGFLGNVDSSTKQCIEGRTVKVLKRKHHRERVIGRTHTGPEGNWVITRKSVKPGTYLAKVVRTPGDSSGVHCAGDRSGKVVYGK